MPTSTRDLADLLRGVAANEQGAFAMLYDATSAKLYGTILRVVDSRPVADDLLQEVYLRIWQHAGEFSAEKASPITWMASIARNRAVDEVRKRKPTRTVTLDDAPEVRSDDEHPLAGAERSEEYRVLLRCLDGLDPEKRDMILLAYYRGLSRNDLAERFGKPVATVKTWLHRSLAQLRLCLAP